MEIQRLQKFWKTCKTREKVLKKNLILVTAIAIAGFCLGTALLEYLEVISVDSWFHRAGLRPATFTRRDEELTVHYVDVGQGDCQIILTDTEAVLIDGGEAENGIMLLNYLESLGVESLDYVIATHFHSDHYGAQSRILREMEAKEVIMPPMPMSLVPDTVLFNELMEVLGEKHTAVRMAEDGMTLNLKNASLKILIPPDINSDDLNNYSLTMRLEHGSNSFLFTGDITKGVEYELLDKGTEALNSTVLKVAHHGSTTSSAVPFLKVVSPDYAVVQSGAANLLDHPRAKVMSDLGNITNNIYRTAVDGNVIFYSNGRELQVTATKGRSFDQVLPEKNPEEEPSIGN